MQYPYFANLDLKEQDLLVAPSDELPSRMVSKFTQSYAILS